MAKIDWYNDNANRSYPFIRETVDQRPLAVPPTIENLPDGVIVDCGFLMGLQSGFDHALHDVFLQEIRREGTTFIYEFASDAPGIAGQPLLFSREVGSEDYQIEHADNFDIPVVSESASVSVSDSASAEPGEEDCPPEPLWSGFLVTGQMEVLEALLAPGESIERIDIGGTIEPALIQSLVDSYIDSFNLGNNDRTRVDAPEGCPPVEWPHPIDQIFVNRACLRGPVRLKPGFNTDIIQRTLTNELTIGASVGAGEGEPCEQVPLFDGESPPVGGESQLFEGGPLCNETVKSINGIGGRLMTLNPGRGVTITPDPESNRLVVDVNMLGLAVCFVSEESEGL
jgi:hypothetical protein